MARVRFAPSPTGNLHIGSVRTALFNWIFSKNQNGKYVLRIEDTDLLRSKPEYEQNILEGLKWLGLDADEGPIAGGDYQPYRQSERLSSDVYQPYFEQLLKEKKAYYCFCTEDELAKEKENAESKGEQQYIYSRKCETLTPDQIQSSINAGKPYVIRFKIPRAGRVTFTDLIRSDIHFDWDLLSDFVIVKSDHTPSYNFAVVVDDMLMNISHVIRGEDHISNTPKQIAVYQALGKESPKFAHLPMILGKDRSKLSKRHGATSVIDYQKDGFLPQAIFNYLVLLGWSSPDEKEIMTKEEIVKQFSLDRITKSGAVFDIVKLRWMNGQYIRKLDKDIYFQTIFPYLSAENKSLLKRYSSDQLKDLLFSVRSNLEVLSDINGYLDVYLMTEEAYTKGVQTIDFSEQDKTVIQLFQQELQQLDTALTPDILSECIAAILQKSGLGKGKVFKPIRLACSAAPSGPDLMAFICIKGKETLIKRLKLIV